MFSRIIAVAALILVLCFVNWSIAGKERHLAEGRIVYLELVPVDPRSLMQGDYMALRFRVANAVYDALPKAEGQRPGRRQKVEASDGYVVVSLDERNIGSFKRLHGGEALSGDEILMRYRVRNGVVKFATNAFFFQEGQGKIYQPARYGQFRVEGNGELLLVEMYDKDLNKLGPEKKQ